MRIHVRHINELIHSCDPIDLYNGNNGYSLCLVNDITNGDISTNNGEMINEGIDEWLNWFLERRKGAETNGVDFNVPEYLLPNQKEIQLTSLFAMNNKNRVRNDWFSSLPFNGIFVNSLPNVWKSYPTVVGIHQMVHVNYTVRKTIILIDDWSSFLSFLGDLMYLQVTTCEEKSFHIIACTKGFYVSQYVLNEIDDWVRKSEI